MVTYLRARGFTKVGYYIEHFIFSRWAYTESTFCELLPAQLERVLIKGSLECKSLCTFAEKLAFVLTS